MKSAIIHCIHEDNDKGIPDTSRYIVVNSIGYYEFDEPVGIMHRKNGRGDYYLSYNHSGRMKVRINGETRMLENGGMFLYRPGQEQYYGQANNEPISCYWVHFTGYGVEPLLAELGIPDIRQVGVGHDIQSLFEYLICESGERLPHYEHAAASVLLQILTLMARKNALLSARRRPTVSERIISDAVRYIQVNVDRPIPITELARLSNMSVNQFSKLFREIEGLPPLQYINRLRLQKAKDLIANTSLSIRQISELVGVDDQLYFCRMFKKYTGGSPTQYKASLLKQLPGGGTDR